MTELHTADQVRCTLDRSLMQEILSHPDVVAAQSVVGPSSRTRRSLLAQALRISPTVLPELSEMLESCRERLGVTTQVEGFVYSSPEFNAACTAPEKDRVFILLSSSLLEAFEGDELRFVVGHEIGHHLYGHHDIPLGAILGEGGTADRELIVKAFRWQRFAEISADRAGLLCCDGFAGAARSFFKLSSGLSQSPDEARIAAYVEQAEELYREHAHGVADQRIQTTDWMSTHPFSPIRLKAANLFALSSVFQTGGPLLERVEYEVQSLLELMDIDYFNDQTDAGAAMRHFFTVAALLLVHADGVITDAEAEAIRALLPDIKLRRGFDLDGISASLKRRIQELRGQVPAARCAQVLRDLSVVAAADGAIETDQIAMLEAWAQALNIPQHVIEQGLRAPKTLDWS